MLENVRSVEKTTDNGFKVLGIASLPSATLNSVENIKTITWTQGDGQNIKENLVFIIGRHC